MPGLGRQASRWLQIVCGCALVVAGAWGVVRSVRAGTAQRVYKRAKYGFFLGTRAEQPRVADASEVLRMCERAHATYPLNYYFPVHASVVALGGALAARDYGDFLRLLRAAEHWNRVSIALNPYAIDAMHVKCRILREKGDLPAAIAFWRDVVLEREFWNPDRHETLVNLYVKAGQTTKAIEAARWLPGGALRQHVLQLEQQRKRPAPAK